MKTITFNELEAQRVKWRATPVERTPLECSGGTQGAIYKSLILGLFLELPVGAWVGEATRKELNSPEDVIEGLKKNIGDETTHDRAIRYVCNAYNISPQTYPDEFNTAAQIHQAWLNADLHPLLKAGAAEVGVFIPNLSLMTIFGGETISELGVNISRDEQRHGIYNRGVLRKIGIELADEPRQLRALREETLDFIFDGVDHMGLDLDFFLEESDNLMQHGYSQELQELTDHFVYGKPFELRNRKLY